MRIAITLACLLAANVCFGHGNPIHVDVNNCLLYTSDAADE